jgi:acyl-CoA synthetase (AMP-forming)/AMP-acid ligase II
VSAPSSPSPSGRPAPARSPELNFAWRLERHATERPESPALILPKGGGWERWSFAELAAKTRRYARALSDGAGIHAGTRVSLLVKPSADFFALGFALFRLGAIPVLIDPGMGLSGFLACVGRIRPTALVGIPPALLLSRVKGKAFESVATRVCVGPGAFLFGARSMASLAARASDAPTPPHAVGADDEAAILFTSGSTGPAKGVRYTHGMFGAQAERIGAMYGIQAGEVDVPCFLPFAMFSMSLGMTVALPKIDFARPATAKPSEVIRAVEAHGAHQLVGSPAVIGPLAAELARRPAELTRLRRVLTFGAPIPRPLHAAMRAVLPEGVEVHTPYGATEALPVATIGSAEILAETGAKTADGAGTCVGRVAPDTEVRIVKLVDGPIERWREGLELPVGEVGEICVRGPQASREYKDEAEATRASKIPIARGESAERSEPEPAAGQDVGAPAGRPAFFHRMGDCGYLDAEGRLWFCGRKAHRVRCSDGHTLFSVMLEGVFNEHAAVKRSAVVGVRGAPVLIVERAPEAPEEGELARELLALAAERPDTRRIKTVLFHPSFPVDRRHNAKIHREQLAAWAETRA